MSKDNKELARILKFLIIVGIVVAAVVTCPDERAHKQAVKEAVRKECVKDGLVVGGGILGSLLTLTVTTTDCIVFSVGTIDSEIVSIGVFGKVFVLTKK